MTFPRERIAIIGGGFGGLWSIAGVKEYGLKPVCFEQTDKHGGTWCYREESVEGVPSTMSTTVINHSKEMGAHSTFPPRKEYNNFMRHHELYQYAMELAVEKDTLKHIQHNSEVLLVKRADDYLETGNWTVTVKNRLTGKVTTDVYDAVLVCNGQMNRPKMPTYHGQDAFKGVIMHTHSLKNVSAFQDKKVVVVGMGCSGLDAAVEATTVAKEVYLSTRSGAFVLHRQGPFGYPFDYILLRRYITCFIDLLPTNLVSWVLESIYTDSYFDHKLYTVKPDHHILSKDPIVNDLFHSKLLAGSIIQKQNIERFTENGVIFKEDFKETEADVVIMATGYAWKFPFLEEGIVVEEDGRINLYKCMFPPHLEHSTLAIVGLFLPFGPGFPIGELQIRWASHIFAGKGKLPSRDVMYKDIMHRHARNVLRYKPSDKMSVKVDFVQFMDELASEIGAKPNLMKIFFTDIWLFLKICFGPCLSYQYRLQGPHKWEGAREAIITCDDRVQWPLTQNKVEESLWMKFVKKILRLIFIY